MRVGVTTSRDSTLRLTEPLVAAGLEPICLPCIRIVPSPDAVLEPLRRAATTADWIVCTSRRAVEITWPDGMSSGPRVAAVGRSTAAAVRAAGGNVGVVGAGGAAELRELLHGMSAESVVVFPHARGADPATVAALQAGGATVVAAPAYETVPIAPNSDPVDAVIFGSTSAVDGWLLSRNLARTTIAVVGETTAVAVRAHGFEPDIVPPVPDVDYLVAALADLRVERRIH